MSVSAGLHGSSAPSRPTRRSGGSTCPEGKAPSVRGATIAIAGKVHPEDESLPASPYRPGSRGHSLQQEQGLPFSSVSPPLEGSLTRFVVATGWPGRQEW